MRWNQALLIATMGAAALTSQSCAVQGSQQEPTFCNPGDNVFCRCRGGAAGTKVCVADGGSFGPCETASGSCAEEAPKADDQEPPPPDAGELLAPCVGDAQCGPGMTCPMGYCTKPCVSFEECAPAGPAAAGDCVIVGGQAICVPYCTTELDCGMYGPDSHCSYTSDALPPYDVVVCANWGQTVVLPPVGYPCADDSMCSLGWMGTESVCDASGCAAGCHVQSDCADPEQACTSSAPDVLGTCGGSPVADGDGCPGLHVDLSANDNQYFHSADTSLLPLPSEADGSDVCEPAAPGLETEEFVYQIWPAESGRLNVVVMPELGFDAVVYARAGACTGGSQVGCNDYGYAGDEEEIDLDVVAGEPVTVFVDGWDGSTGPYSVLFTLSSW